MKEEYNVGSIKISEDVIAGIANMAACEVEGVARLVSKGITNPKSLIANFKPAVKGVSIATTPEGLELTLQAALQQGYKIQDVAKKIQQNVSDAVQNMTGLTVKTVNVIVVGLVESKSEDIGNE